MPEINPNPTHTKSNYKFRNKSKLYPIFRGKIFSSFHHIWKDFFPEYVCLIFVLRAANEMAIEHLETYK